MLSLLLYNILQVSEVFISSFISLYSLDTLFIEKNLPCLIYELIKALEIRTLMVFNLAFPSNTILSCFFFFFFIIDLQFLITAVIIKIIIPTAELVIPTGIAAKGTNAEIETQLVTAEAKIRKCSTCIFILLTY